MQVCVEYCLDTGIAALTLFAFSSENWKRPADEVGALLKLFLRMLDSEVDELHRRGVRLGFIGDRAAFPEEVRRALANMDADGKGEFPKFFGGFECRVNRPIGPRSPWLIETDVELTDASGKFVSFPYFLEHVKGLVKVREGYVDIVNARTTKGDATLAIDGRVTWRAGAGGRPLEPGRTYRVAVPDFLARGGDGLAPVTGALPPERADLTPVQGMDLRLALIAYGKSRGGTLTAPPLGRVRYTGVADCPAAPR